MLITYVTTDKKYFKIHLFFILFFNFRYSLRGGMQDFNYLSSNDFDITLELGCDKYPPTSDLEREWYRNSAALFNFIWQAHIGIKGFVYDVHSKEPIPDATIHVKNVTAEPYDIAHDIISFQGGDYYRLLTPGVYKVTAFKSGYLPHVRLVTVFNPYRQPAQRIDFGLKPIRVSFFFFNLFYFNSAN